MTNKKYNAFLWLILMIPSFNTWIMEDYLQIDGWRKFYIFYYCIFPFGQIIFILLKNNKYLNSFAESLNIVAHFFAFILILFADFSMSDKRSLGSKPSTVRYILLLFLPYLIIRFLTVKDDISKKGIKSERIRIFFFILLNLLTNHII